VGPWAGMRLAANEATSHPSVFLVRGGRKVSLGSIMGVMSIAAGVGSVVLVTYENSTIQAIEGLLRLLRCTPAKGESRLWVADWAVAGGDGCLFDADSVPQFSSWAWT